jgi:hypothetical protein
MYSLEKAFQVAERMELAKAFAMGWFRGADEQYLEVVAAATGAGITTYGADRTPPACYRCGQHGHKGDGCALPQTVDVQDVLQGGACCCSLLAEDREARVG